MAETRPYTITRRFIKWALCTIIIFLLVSILQVFSLTLVNPPFTLAMAWKWLLNKDNARRHLTRLEWYPLKKISPHLRRAVLAAEDQRFIMHHGFDFTEINKAIKDMALQKRVRGASTISMQVARTVFLWPERSWLRKMLEAYYTVCIELILTKERIFEIYLNTVDWGTWTIGAGAASQRYFHVRCSALNSHQAALMAAVLPNPHKLSPIAPSRFVLEKQRRILRDMKKMPLLF